ncbi:MAG TPA: hypothetical protein VFJ90_08880 [Candidatus Didemnitutus sp.]|nr:hypothetical protein [Candidatus Didemnitutus sp.]
MGEITQRTLVTVDPDATLHDRIALLLDNNIGGMPMGPATPRGAFSAILTGLKSSPRACACIRRKRRTSLVPGGGHQRQSLKAKIGFIPGPQVP